MDAGEGATASYMKGPAMARILCVDNYDSFVFTIVGYLRHLGAIVDVVRNDVVDPAWFEAGYDGVLISPGPGDPKSAGTSLQTIADCAERGIPMLGVCLGHQALGELFGATVGHAPELMHGKTSVITHDGRGVFEGVPSPLTVTRYHSLTIEDAVDRPRDHARRARGLRDYRVRHHHGRAPPLPAPRRRPVPPRIRHDPVRAPHVRQLAGRLR